MCIHPDRATHTQTDSRAAGSDRKRMHVPASPHTHIYSEPTASRAAGGRVLFQLTHKPSTHRPVTTIPLKKTHTWTGGQPVVGLTGVCTRSRVHAHTHTHIHMVWSEARATGTTKGKQTRGEFLNHIRMCRREGGSE